ncbi:hypothetical protein BDD43_2619 [Mucilaginibacter gracilis]|uniref:Luciferase domain-containing protein n=1 Tax=Mucilaginibacter gracilis TaxID=423350 RepID=A0A495J351_9SPHI|nr:luciferase family protein [Mucilaginibacter gracilis]RKR82439.1 hypothetical protein BDD43_2619 [Mucilaginibacter gracilis]
MFKFIIKYLGFLKVVPMVALVFDCMLKLLMLITNPAIANYIDELEATVLRWPGTSTTLHKYGGIQFNYRGTEIGHIHSNSLLDILLSLKTKQMLLAEGRATDHHTFIKSGWVSFYIKNDSDARYAVKLLKLGYQKHTKSVIQ